MSHQTIPRPPGVPPRQPQFSQVNTFTLRPGDKLVAITGQLAIALEGVSAPPRGFEDQVRMALQNLENCLKAAGAANRDIFKVTHHVVGFDYEKQNPAKVFIEWLGSEHMLPVERLALPGGLYEIETWAIVPGGLYSWSYVGSRCHSVIDRACPFDDN